MINIANEFILKVFEQIFFLIRTYYSLGMVLRNFLQLIWILGVPGNINGHCLPENHVETWEDEEDEKPEPESDEDLVIDHVDGEDTQSIKSNIETELLLNHFKLKCSDTFEYFLKLRSFEKNIS